MCTGTILLAGRYQHRIASGLIARQSCNPFHPQNRCRNGNRCGIGFKRIKTVWVKPIQSDAWARAKLQVRVFESTHCGNTVLRTFFSCESDLRLTIRNRRRCPAESWSRSPHRTFVPLRAIRRACSRHRFRRARNERDTRESVSRRASAGGGRFYHRLSCHSRMNRHSKKVRTADMNRID